MRKKRPEQLVTDYILANVKNNVIPWRQPWTHGIRHSFRMPQRNNAQFYKGINVLILTVACLKHDYISPYWLTYNQCAEEGGNVKKGARGVSILFFTPLEVDSDRKDEDKKVVPLVKKYTVFNIEQAENLPDDTVNHRMAIEQPTHQIHDYISATGAKILPGSDQAAYHPSFDVIRLPNQSAFDDEATYAGVVAHELIHWTAHADRVDRPHNYDDPDERAYEELVAEIGSLMLCARLGINSDMDGHSIPYIASWIRQMENNPRYILKASADAEKAVSWIMEKVDATNSKKVA